MALKDTNKGKLIYQPAGPAGEYAKWAVNLHNGCTHGCTYCYNNRGFMSHAFGDEPKMKIIVKKRAAARAENIKKESTLMPKGAAEKLALKNTIIDILRDDIKKLDAKRLMDDGGVFFSFKCDPMEQSNLDATFFAAYYLLQNFIPVTILTKCTDWLGDTDAINILLRSEYSHLLTIGFTLTGMDDMEVNAPSTTERIEALRKVHEMGIKTFVSLEPVIDISKAIDVLHDCLPYSDEIRIGLQSPYKKDRYTRSDIIRLLSVVQPMQTLCPNVNIVLKDSVYRQCEVFGIKVDKE